MTCTTIPFLGGFAIVCGPRRRPRRCSQPGCGAPGELQCDYPTGRGRTCDLYICAVHAIRIGPDLDHCPRHAGKPHQSDLFESADAGL